MAEKSEGHPCHWTHAHTGHTWWPLVPDPVEDRVLHVGLVELWCSGVDADA